MFGKPTWGPSAAFAQPALNKLQAIDWGVSDTASSFDVYLDDIALYWRCAIRRGGACGAALVEEL